MPDTVPVIWVVALGGIAGSIIGWLTKLWATERKDRKEETKTFVAALRKKDELINKKDDENTKLEQRMRRQLEKALDELHSVIRNQPQRGNRPPIATPDVRQSQQSIGDLMDYMTNATQRIKRNPDTGEIEILED